MNTNNKVLVLGRGYIGNQIQNRLNCDIKSSSEINYHDKKDLAFYLLNNGIETVVNCSGFTGTPNIDEAELKKEQCWFLNTQSPLNINRLCNDLGVKYIHISSGCIYNGYNEFWTEDDKPNFGLFENHSSFYSKSKHAFEVLSSDMRNIILRIRMPIGDDLSNKRNYLTKIRHYDALINYRNSKTYIPDLCEVVYNICFGDIKMKDREIVNVVNPVALNTQEVCGIMESYGFHNKNWKFVSIRDLPIITGRSNCVMDSSKVYRIHEMMTETQALTKIYEKEKERIITSGRDWK
jgi:dTDP-4-dehydrorhamnose reductase